MGRTLPELRIRSQLLAMKKRPASAFASAEGAAASSSDVPTQLPEDRGTGRGCFALCVFGSAVGAEPGGAFSWRGGFGA
eukprot:15430850-Alexandrium_andersonii.AAC.1